LRSYLVDEVSGSDIRKACEFLNRNAIRSDIEDVFWVPLPESLLSIAQVQHPHCAPHVFAIELGDTWIKVEFFVRSLASLRCECQSYTTPEQMQFIIEFLHHMLSELDIET